MPWFRHPVSGQVFEAEGVWEELARRNGCVEVPPPDATVDSGEQGHETDDGSDRVPNTRSHRRRPS